MQEGRRYLVGEACSETNSGQHIIEIEQDQPTVWCCHCATEFYPCYRCLLALYTFGKVGSCCKEMFIGES